MRSRISRGTASTIFVFMYPGDTVFTVTPLRGDLARERHRESVHPRLGGGVVGLAELALDAVEGGDVDDPSETALRHPVDDVLGHVEDAVEVGGQNRIPLVLVELSQWMRRG